MFFSKKTDEPTPDDSPADSRAAEKARLMAIYKSPSQVALKPKGPLTQEDRIAGLIEEAQKRAPPQIAQLLQQAGPVIVPVINLAIPVFNFVAPLYIKLCVAIYTFLTWLPWDLFQALMGLGLCFFGGGYCASIAACEAFAMTGWPVTKRHLTDVWESAGAIVEAQRADSKKDADGDGVADVDRLPASQLIDRKMRVAAQAVKEPQKLAQAVGGLYTGWVAVQGVLRVKFARTINLALSCSQFVEYYVTKALLPFLTPFVPKEFVHWLPTFLSSSTRGFFVYLAWKLQEVISAVQSGLRGGLMFSRGLLNWLNKRGFYSIGPFSLKHEDTYIDELVGYAVAALGFYVQWNLGFGVPFPFNIVLMPLDMVEWYIRYSVTTGGTGTGTV